MKSTLKLLAHQKFLTFLTLLMLTIQSLSSVGSAMSLAYITNALIAKSLSAVMNWLLIAVAFWAVTLISNYIASILQAQVVRRINNQLRARIVDGLNAVSLPDYQKIDHNEYVSWLTNDVNSIATNGLNNFFSLYGSATALIFSAVALFTYHWILAVSTVALGGLTLLLPNLFGRIMQRETKRLADANSKLLGRLEDVISGFSVFFAHNIGTVLTQKVVVASDDQGAEQVAYTRHTGLVEVIIGGASVIAQMLTMAITCYMVLKGYFSIGVISSSGQLSGNVFSQLSSVISGLFQSKSVEALLEKDIKPAPAATESTASTFNTALTLDHLTFAYNDSKNPVINDLSYRFEKGGKYAIVGKSGTGKSTLINLISGRLNNYNGAINVDDRELKTMTTPSLNGTIELVDQKPYLFNESVEENITLGVNRTKSLLKQAVSFLGIDTFTSLDANIKEHGQNFSGGQRQKLALARALTFDKPILILDEMTAGIDAESAQQIEDTLLDNQDLTVIMITHTLTEKTKERLTDVLELG